MSKSFAQFFEDARESDEYWIEGILIGIGEVVIEYLMGSGLTESQACMIVRVMDLDNLPLEETKEIVQALKEKSSKGIGLREKCEKHGIDYDKVAEQNDAVFDLLTGKSGIPLGEE